MLQGEDSGSKKRKAVGSGMEGEDYTREPVRSQGASYGSANV